VNLAPVRVENAHAHRARRAASQQRLDDDHCGEVQEKRHGETCFEIVVGHCRIAPPDEESDDTRRLLHSAKVLDQGRPCTTAPPPVLSGLWAFFGSKGARTKRPRGNIAQRGQWDWRVREREPIMTGHG